MCILYNTEYYRVYIQVDARYIVILDGQNFRVLVFEQSVDFET